MRFLSYFIDTERGTRLCRPRCLNMGTGSERYFGTGGSLIFLLVFCFRVYIESQNIGHVGNKTQRLPRLPFLSFKLPHSKDAIWEAV